MTHRCRHLSHHRQAPNYSDLVEYCCAKEIYVKRACNEADEKQSWKFNCLKDGLSDFNVSGGSTAHPHTQGHFTIR